MAAFDASARTSDRRDGGHSGLAPGTEGCEPSWWAPRRARGTGSEVVDSSTLRFLTASSLEAKRKEEVAREEKEVAFLGCFFLWNAGGRPMADLAGTSAARDRRLRSWLRHERMTVRIALAEALHQSCGHRSSTAGPRRFSEEFAAETLFSQLARRKKKRRKKKLPKLRGLLPRGSCWFSSTTVDELGRKFPYSVFWLVGQWIFFFIRQSAELLADFPQIP